MPPHAKPLLAAAVLACSLVVPVTHAVKPQQWQHTAEADFEPGVAEGVVITNLGDIKLARQVESLADLPEATSVVHDAVRLGQTVYLAVGPEPRVMAWDGQALSEFAAMDEGQVFALGTSGDRLLVGVSGDTARVVTLDAQGGVAVSVDLPEGVRYVWDIATLPGAGGMVVATGPEGQVFHLTGDGPAVEAMYDAEQANVLSLALSPTADGFPLYAGTDTDGLVYRFSATDEPPYVVYDAAEPEVAAIVVGEDGHVYFGTADAEQARPGRLEEAAEGEAGRPATQPAPADNAGQAPPAPDDLPRVPPSPAPTDQAVDAAASAAPDEANAEDPDNSAEGDDTAEAGPAEPTPGQRDRLRELVRQRLLAARRSGTLQAPAGSGSTAGRSARPAPAAASTGDKSGNAVYRLDPNGFVAEVFRESVIVLDLALVDDQLFVATGTEGQVYRVDPAAGETTTLADLDAEYVTRLLADPGNNDAPLLLTTASPASLDALDANGTASTGTFTSAILDASQVSLWGKMHVTADLPPRAGVKVETRSGNVIDPETAPWSAWQTAAELDGGQDLNPLHPIEIGVVSPPARYFQYRLTLDTDTDSDRPDPPSPVVTRVSQTYITPNQPPRLASLTAAYPDTPTPQPGQPAPPPPTGMNVAWEATDPNADRLAYTLDYRPALVHNDPDAFVTVVEDHPQATYEWQTRQVPDGYYQLRLTASDAPDNPPDMALTATRLSDPVLVDNTPPTIEVNSIADGGKDFTQIKATITDALSPIASVAYAVDSADEYQALLPDDLIADSTSETITINLRGSAERPKVITLRVTDARGNITYHAIPLDRRRNATPGAR
ncbi:MAG: hypothetical protein AAF842_11510 [Planctomycetota bacterium]